MTFGRPDPSALVRRAREAAEGSLGPRRLVVAPRRPHRLKSKAPKGVEREVRGSQQTPPPPSAKEVWGRGFDLTRTYDRQTNKSTCLERRTLLRRREAAQRFHSEDVGTGNQPSMPPRVSYKGVMPVGCPLSRNWPCYLRCAFVGAWERLGLSTTCASCAYAAGWRLGIYVLRASGLAVLVLVRICCLRCSSCSGVLGCSALIRLTQVAHLYSTTSSSSSFCCWALWTGFAAGLVILARKLVLKASLMPPLKPVRKRPSSRPPSVTSTIVSNQSDPW